MIEPWPAPRPGARSALSVAVVLSCSVLLTGCGDDAEDAAPAAAQCQTEECRGDVTGSWTVTGGCAREPSATAPDCPGWTCTVTGAQASGAFEFGSDGAASLDWMASLISSCHLPQSCLAGSDCAGFAADHPARSCAASGDACDCTQTDTDSGTASGTWRVANGFLLEVDTGTGMTGTSNWCVRDGSLSYEVLVNQLLELPGEFVPLTPFKLNLSRRRE